MIDIAYLLLKKHLINKVSELDNVYYYNPIIDNLEKEPEIPLPCVMLQFTLGTYTTLADGTQQCPLNISVHLYNEFNHEDDNILDSLRLRNKIHKALQGSKHNLKHLQDYAEEPEDVRILNSLTRVNSNVTHPYYQISKTIDVYSSLFTDNSAKKVYNPNSVSIEINAT